VGWIHPEKRMTPTERTGKRARRVGFQLIHAWPDSAASAHSVIIIVCAINIMLVYEVN